MTTPADCILDTNGFLDLFSNADIMSEYEKPSSDVESPQSVFRRARARESILLCCYLNEVGADTFVLGHEALTQLEKLAPPKQDSVQSYHTTQVIHFLNDYVLKGFASRLNMINLTDDETGKPLLPKGNAADQALVDFAKSRGLPIVTNEGFSKDGYAEGGIGERARKAGVPWFHPCKFYAGKIDEAAQMQGFFDRFRDGVPEYVKTAPQGALDALKWMSGYYRHVLLGETRGRSTPVRVTI